MLTDRQRLDALYRLSDALRHQEADTQSVLRTALLMAGQTLGASHGCVVVFHRDDKLDDLITLASDDEGQRKLWKRSIEHGLIGFVHHSQRTIIVRDISTDPRWGRLKDALRIPQTGSAIGLPMEKNGYTYGVMAFIHPEIDGFDADTVEFLQAIGNILATAIGNVIVHNATPKDENRYQWLFEDGIMPIIITDLNGYIVDANRKACEILQYKRPDLLQLHITAIHRMGTGPVGANRFESLQMGKEIAFRSTAWPSEGNDIPVMVRARRLFFDNHDVIAWVEEDLSAQMELDQLRQDLAAMVYHDLRGPLHTINGSLSTLARLLAKLEQPTIQDLLQVGIRSTKQLSRMVESLLDIQRLEEGKAILNAKPASIHNILASAAQLVQPLAHESNQHLLFQLTNDIPIVAVDADMILRVITNLMENAVKYTPGGGSITLGAALVDGHVRISVGDSGPGIPRHMQKQIFDKFSRVKYKDAPKGVGLGLAFCRLAIEAHGGQIWVESEPGQGSMFYFTLPVNYQAETVRA